MEEHCRKKLQQSEIVDLVNRLSSNISLIKDSYKYPLADLIANLEEHGDKMNNSVGLDVNGNPCKYFLHFVSPPSTWEDLCGVEGIYSVDAITLQAESFELICMN